MLVAIVLVVLLIPLIPLLVLVAREIGRTRNFFAGLAKHYRGRVSRFPIGVAFRLEPGLEVKVHALQGSILYRARIRLREDPGILVTRKFRRWEFLDRLNYSPGRRRYRLNGPIDERYAFRAFDDRLLREVFQGEILEKMATEERVTRIEITRNRFRGTVMMVTFSPEEVERGDQSVDILNAVLRRVVS